MGQLFKRIFKREKYPEYPRIDDVTKRYEAIYGELREILNYAPLKKRKQEKQFNRIKWLETYLHYISMYADSSPEFFTDERMSEIEGLLTEAHEYLNLTSKIYPGIYNCFVDIHTIESFREDVQRGKTYYEMYPKKEAV